MSGFLYVLLGAHVSLKVFNVRNQYYAVYKALFVIELHEFDAVAVFGGDTAFAILQASSGPPLHPLGEVLPGVPLSRIGAAGSGRHNRGLERFLITKAGGFGPVDLLPALKAVLSPI